ncbi:MAG: hypothetical protein BroJett011_07130 [Chloroflexota bacterium]|nr:MAG: hypothetical protein BroJett011_07130 [Chloroflexota bacterium]
MVEDPIVEEVRKVRQEYAAKFNYDLRSIFLDMKAKEVEYRKKGWKVVSFRPEKIKAKREKGNQPSLPPASRR